MARKIDKQEFHNMISPVMRLSFGISNIQENKRFNPKKKMANKQYYAEVDPYETPTFAYNREMDQLVVTNTFNRKVEEENITRPNDEEKSEGPKTTHPKDMTTNLDEEEEKSATPWSEMGSNDVNITLKEIGSAHFVRHKGPQNS
jgi:hypothetical protein